MVVVVGMSLVWPRVLFAAVVLEGASRRSCSCAVGMQMPRTEVVEAGAPGEHRLVSAVVEIPHVSDR
jgi:hypothetical protein